jgi:prevent-host-death family protein
MNEKLIGSAEFKASCLKIIDRINKDRQAVTITRRGKPVARLLPLHPTAEGESIIGAMKGSVLRFDDPFMPAVETSDWNAAQ